LKSISGGVRGFKLNNSADYYYLRNLQGDIVGIYDDQGNIVCRYTYDAWGNVISVKDSGGTSITSATHIANLNPIRYRGYYYDSDTGTHPCTKAHKAPGHNSGTRAGSAP